MPIADRKDECAIFERLLLEEVAARILLFEATGERGKSTLMTEFARRAREEWGRDACAIVELKQGVSLRQVFHGIYQDLGSEICNRYKRIRNSQASHGVAVNADLSGVSMGNSNQITVGSNILLPDKKLEMELAEALIEDLLFHPKPLLVILDTYDQATPESIKWLLGPLFSVVARNRKLFCIVAGRTIPQPNEYQGRWADIVSVVTLKPEISLDDWHEYACGMFPGFPRESLATVYVGLRDRPGSIRTYIQNAGKFLVPPKTEGISA